MGRLTPTKDIVRALFARSGNQCAFPDCSHILINERNDFVGQICHIEAAQQGGERFNPNMSNEERRSYDNLILLCYAHHVETNHIEDFSVEKLKAIKKYHEDRCKLTTFKISESSLLKISQDAEKYWEDIKVLNTTKHSLKEMAFEINASASFFELCDEIRAALESIKYAFEMFNQSNRDLLKDLKLIFEENNLDFSIVERIPYCHNPFYDRNWESHNIGTPNSLNKLYTLFSQVEIRYYEEFLKTNSDELISMRFENLKRKFAVVANNLIYVD